MYVLSDHVWFKSCYLFYGDFIYDLCCYAVIFMIYASSQHNLYDVYLLLCVQYSW